MCSLLNCLVFYSMRPQISTCLLMASTFPESSLLVSWFNHDWYINNATHYEVVCINDSYPSCTPDPSMTVRADITGRYANRLYAYEPVDMKLCKSKAVLMPKWVIPCQQTNCFIRLGLFPQCWATCKEPWSFWRQSCEHKSPVFLSVERILLPWGSLLFCHLFTDGMKRTVKLCTKIQYVLWVDCYGKLQAFIFMFFFSINEVVWKFVSPGNLFMLLFSHRLFKAEAKWVFQLKGQFTQKWKFCHLLTSCSKPVWVSFYCWTQKKTFTKMLVTK